MTGRLALAAVLVGCGAAAPAPSEVPEADTGLSADDDALLDRFEALAIAACRGGFPRRPTGIDSFVRREPPCGLARDAHWTYAEAEILADGTGQTEECNDCTYEASTRTMRCRVDHYRLAWTVGADGRPLHEDIDRDDDGTTDAVIDRTPEPDGWIRETTAEAGERRVRRIRRTARDGEEREEHDLDADGTTDDATRTVHDAAGFPMEIWVARGTWPESVVLTCTAPSPTERLCTRDDSREAFTLDTGGRVVAYDLDFGADGVVDRRTRSTWHGDRVVAEEVWHHDVDAPSALALERRRIDDGRRAVTLDADGPRLVTLTELQCGTGTGP